MTPKTLIIAALLCAPATGSHATEWISCSATDGAASISVLAGHLSVLNVSRANLQVGKRSWSTNPELEPGAPITVGQAYADGEKMLVDILDGDFNATVAQLRVFQLEGSEYPIQGGVLRVEGFGAWPVSCEGQ